MMVQKLSRLLLNKSNCITLRGATQKTLLGSIFRSQKTSRVLDRVCGCEKSDVRRDIILSLAYKRTSERWLRVSDHFSALRRKGNRHFFFNLLKDVKLAGTGSPGLGRAAGANSKYSHRSPELRRAVRPWH